jgi:hypothetical protein
MRPINGQVATFLAQLVNDIAYAARDPVSGDAPPDRYLHGRASGRAGRKRVTTRATLYSSHWG